MNNLKQCGLAVHLYAQDYDEYILPYQCSKGAGNYWYFFDFLAMYLPTKDTITYKDDGGTTRTRLRVLICPSATKPWAWFGTYNYNTNVGAGIKLSKVRKASQKMLMADAKGGNAYGLENSNHINWTRHGATKAANVLFFDGHVERFYKPGIPAYPDFAYTYVVLPGW